MNIENEKDLQAWLELYKVMIADNPEVIFNDCANTADEAFKQYKKRAKALEESVQEDGWIDWCGEICTTRYMLPAGGPEVEVVYRDGSKDHGCVDDFSWTHLDAGTDIVKFKYV